MSCFLPPDDAPFSPNTDERPYNIRLMDRAITAVDTHERAVLIALSSAHLPGPPPGVLLSEKETAALILSLQAALLHCRSLPLDAE